MKATPAYVISGVEERWQHARHTLASLHLAAERVVPPKPTVRMAKEMFASYDYDKQINLTEPLQQKYFSLLSGFESALHRLAHHPDLGPDDFAVVVEDDVSLDNRMSIADARAAILHGFDLARSDGWLYLGMCSAWCDEASMQVYRHVAYSRCAGVGSHALAFTKRRAATFLADVHASVKHRLATDPKYIANNAHSFDRMLIAHTQKEGLAWLAPSSFAGLHSDFDDPKNGGCGGVFFQDRARFRSTIDTRRWRAQSGWGSRLLLRVLCCAARACHTSVSYECVAWAE